MSFFFTLLRVHKLLGVFLALQCFGLPDGNSVLPSLACLLCLVPACLGLIAQHLGTGIVGLLLVNVLHEDTLVLEYVTLHL